MCTDSKLRNVCAPRLSVSLLTLAVASLSSTAMADDFTISLDLRGDTNKVIVGQEIEIGLYAVSDGRIEYDFSAIEAVIVWDPSKLELLDDGDRCGPDYIFCGFIDDPCGLNEADPPYDGDGFFTVTTNGAGIPATPEGTLVATFRFRGRGDGRTTVDIAEARGDPVCDTVVFAADRPNHDVTGSLSGKRVRVFDCGRAPLMDAFYNRKRVELALIGYAPDTRYKLELLDNAGNVVDQKSARTDANGNANKRFKGISCREEVHEVRNVHCKQTIGVSLKCGNAFPKITSIPFTSVNEDTLYTYDFTSEDPNAGDTLTVTAPVLPAWLNFTDNGDGTAALDGTPTNDEVGDHSVTLRVEDQHGAGVDQSFTITVINVNDPPVLNLNGPSNAAFTEDGGAVATLDTNTTIIDVDLNDTNMESAMVTITNNLDAGFEVLSANTGGTNITALYTEPTLMLTGTDTLANYQAVLDSVTYDNTDQNPDETDRTPEWKVNDGEADSNVETSTVEVTGENDAPVLDLNIPPVPGQFVEDGGPVPVLPTIPSITDVDDVNLESAEIRNIIYIDAGFEILSATTGGTNITASYTAPVLTLSGTDTLANYQAVLATVTYDNTNDDPDPNTRRIRFSVNDGDDDSNPDFADVTVTPVNDCPIAVDDEVTTDEDTVLNGDVLGTNPTTPDSDAEGDPITVTDVNGNVGDVGVQIPLGTGLLTVNADGTFNFDPDGGYEYLAVSEQIVESFTYTVDDGSGTCSETATVTVTIDGLNDMPTAEDDSGGTDEATVLNEEVLADNGNGADSDPDDSDVLTVSQVEGNPADVGVQITLASGALVTVNAVGTFTYDPNGAFDALDAGEQAFDSFTYEISDGNGGTDTATVTVTIDGIT